MGVVDLEGNAIFPLKYEKIDFSLTRLIDLPNNSTDREEIATYALITKNGKQGIVDLQGNEIVTPQYDRLNPALLKGDYIVATKNRKRGIINLQGNTIVPFKYDGINYADKIDLGYIIATKVIQNNKKNSIDTTGKTILDTKNYPPVSEKKLCIYVKMRSHCCFWLINLSQLLMTLD